jgi:hypothetical protein
VPAGLLPASKLRIYSELTSCQYCGRVFCKQSFVHVTKCFGEFDPLMVDTPDRLCVRRPESGVSPLRAFCPETLARVDYAAGAGLLSDSVCEHGAVVARHVS